MLTPRPPTFVRLPRNIVDPANRALTYWSLAKRESSSFGLTMLAAEKTFLACEIYDFTALSEAREHD